MPRAPAAWEFPPGTRLWKEFSVNGRRVETRLIERLDDGEWRFAAYAWNEAGREATLAPAEGATPCRCPRAVATRFPRGTIARPATAARRCRCSASPRCSSRRTATRSRRTPSRAARRDRPCRPGGARPAQRPAAGHARCAAAHPGADAREAAPRSATCTRTAATATATLRVSAGVVPVGLNLWIDPADPDAAVRAQAELLQETGRYRGAGDDAGRRLVPGDASGRHAAVAHALARPAHPDAPAGHPDSR
jgi:hypothetical protein